MRDSMAFSHTKIGVTSPQGSYDRDQRLQPKAGASSRWFSSARGSELHASGAPCTGPDYS